jgi:PqqD family protein of HPr-rel-A system
MTDAGPRQRESLEVNEADDGLVVYDADSDTVHHLNASAAVIFELCNGTRDAEEIARILAEAYGLGAPPIDDTLAGLGELVDRGLIRWDGRPESRG